MLGSRVLVEEIINLFHLVLMTDSVQGNDGVGQVPAIQRACNDVPRLGWDRELREQSCAIRGSQAGAGDSEGDTRILV